MKSLTGQEVIAKLAEGSLEIVYARQEEDGTVYCTGRPVKLEPLLPATDPLRNNPVVGFMSEQQANEILDEIIRENSGC